MSKAHEHLKSKLEFARVFYKAPAVMAVIIRNNGSYALSAMTGVRKADLAEDAQGNQVLDNDTFQLASCSKPVSGYMLAILLKLTKYNWETTIGEVFPELTDRACRTLYNIRDDFLRASIRDMMSHTARFRYAPEKGTHISLAGLIGSFDDEQKREYCSRNAEVRRRFNYMITSQQDSPGPEGVYNGGPILPVAMFERITAKSYQSLMQEYVFDPLEMKDANIGRPATRAIPPDGVWPHSFDFSSLSFVPSMGNVTRVKEYEAHMPAGGINFSAADCGKFIASQFVNGPANRPLKGAWLEETFPLYKNGCSVSGWLPSNQPKPDIAVSHDGDFGIGHARITVWPYKGEGYAVITNGGGEGEMDGVEKFNIGSKVVGSIARSIKEMLDTWNTRFPGE